MSSGCLTMRQEPFRNQNQPFARVPFSAQSLLPSCWSAPSPARLHPLPAAIPSMGFLSSFLSGTCSFLPQPMITDPFSRRDPPHTLFSSTLPDFLNYFLLATAAGSAKSPLLLRVSDTGINSTRQSCQLVKVQWRLVRFLFWSK